MGMYAVERSGDTERMRILGSTSCSVRDMRLISRRRVRYRRTKESKKNARQRAFVSAPTSADGASTSSSGLLSSSAMRVVTAVSRRRKGGYTLGSLGTDVSRLGGSDDAYRRTLRLGRAAKTARWLSCLSAMCALRKARSWARKTSRVRGERCQWTGARSRTTARWEGSMGRPKMPQTCRCPQWMPRLPAMPRPVLSLPSLHRPLWADRSLRHERR